MIQRGWWVLVISTLLGFLSVEQGGRKSCGTLGSAFPLQTQVGPPGPAAAGDLPLLLFFVPSQKEEAPANYAPYDPRVQASLLSQGPGTK